MKVDYFTIFLVYVNKRLSPYNCFKAGGKEKDAERVSCRWVYDGTVDG